MGLSPPVPGGKLPERQSGEGGAGTDGGPQAGRQGMGRRHATCVRCGLGSGDAPLASHTDGSRLRVRRPVSVFSEVRLGQRTLMQRVGLVGCVKSKRSVPTAAADLYTSTLFVGRRRWVEASCERWFILSAKHGVVPPDELIEPY